MGSCVAQTTVMPSSAFSEQQLYDDVTSYIRSYYNKAKLLNRSAARFAMSVFQRRLASSTYAILCSLKRREEKLQALIDDIRSGKLDEQQLVRLQQMLDDFDYDAFDEQTADEEESEEGLEGNEAVHDRALGGVLALNLAELEAERQRVDELVELAQRVYNKGEESKFQKLQTIFEHPDYRDQKIIVFTEHRDTLNYLVSRLEGIGHAGHVATIHGAMSYKVREEQREFFRRLPEEGGAQFLVATDAAGEGINLQFCWIMVNFDIPWNPARLEQRMGRIHRYGQAYAADRHSAIYVPYPAFPSVPDSPLIDRQWLYPAHRLSSSTTPTAQYATDVKQNS